MLSRLCMLTTWCGISMLAHAAGSFGSFDYNAYKQRWAEGGQTLISFVAFNTTLRGRWLELRASILRPLYRRLRALLSGPACETGV